ncbi:MAG: transglycosylase domain-containing protein [Oscillospiraceae bacterium]|nr:transglycosylase domain-containing protein [Oscillospiraceae bacterium]
MKDFFAKSKGSPKKKMDPQKKKILVRVLTVVFTFALIGVLSVSAVGAYMLYNVNKIVGGDELLNLNEYMLNQTQTTIVYTKDADGNEVTLAKLHGEVNRIWVESNEIPEHVKNAFVALEDKRFYDHPGVDWRRTAKAFLGVFAPGGSSEGGSTITQQLIKNLTGDNGQTFVRKFNEILKALNLTQYFSKDTILTTYLNTLYLDQGCYGVEAAAEYYFGKTVGELNVAEAACLAAVTKAPRAYNPILNFEDNRDRQRWCLDEMYDQGYIKTEEELQAAKDYKLVFRNSENFVPSESVEERENEQKDDQEENDVQSFYVDYIVDQVMQHFQDQYGYTKAEAFQKVYYGGLKIYAAVDTKLQGIMEDVYYNRKGFPDEEDTKKNPAVQSAMTVVDYEGRLLGIVGQAGKKTQDRVLNIAADSPRQPGSSIKPLSVYAPGINEKAIHWSSKFQNYGFNLNGTVWPKNYDGSGGPNEYLTVQAALPPSLNTIPAQIFKTGRLSFETSFNYLQNNFHISTLTPNDKDYSPLAVGGMAYGVTSLELAAAYATFGNGGKYYEPYSYYSVTNYLGNKVLLSQNKVPEQAIEPASAEVMLHLLKTVVTGDLGTARSYYVKNFQDNMYAKTGTTTENKDRWFVGATPYAVCSVWVGYKTPKNLSGSAYQLSGKLFKTVMDRYHADLDPDVEFPFEPGNAVQRRYCLGSGNLARATCARTAVGWYRYDYIPSTCVNCNAYGDGTEELTSEESTTGLGETTTDIGEPTTEPITIPITTELPVTVTIRPTDPDRETQATRRPE